MNKKNNAFNEAWEHRCPMCMEEVHPDARICPYCRTRFEYNEYKEPGGSRTYAIIVLIFTVVTNVGSIFMAISLDYLAGIFIFPVASIVIIWAAIRYPGFMKYIMDWIDKNG